MVKRRSKSDSDALEEYEAKPYVPPQLSSSFVEQIKRAREMHVDVNRSDPFAGARVNLHMRRGLLLPSDVIADAQGRKAAKADR